METNSYQRLEMFWQSLGMKKASAFIDSVPGLTAAALSAMKQRGSKPSASIMRAIQLAYPVLNPDFILWGEGDMKLEAESVGESKTRGGFGDDVEAAVLRALLADRDKTIAAQAAEIAKLNRELGKSNDSPDAAGPTPTTPRKPVDGFLTSAQRAEMAADFNDFVEAQLSEGTAVVRR